MNSIDDFRTAFRLHLRDERKYRAFLNRWSGRGCEWQDDMLEAFFKVHPEHRLSDDQLDKALRVCEVHGADLRLGKVSVSLGCIDYTLDYLEDRERLFPHACLESIEGQDGKQTEASVWYCAECRSVQMQHEKWKPIA